ncbi:hypothetical protein OG21DRAFT_1526023 [Imleria badia]|nr:hypothetical protein OG21DRAFT_1526023 [Imleria badia]
MASLTSDLEEFAIVVAVDIMDQCSGEIQKVVPIHYITDLNTSNEWCVRKCATFFILINKSTNLGFKVSVIHSGSRNLDDINMGTFHHIGSPMNRGAKEQDAGSNILHKLEFGDLLMFKDIAFLPTTKLSIDNMLLVMLEITLSLPHDLFQFGDASSEMYIVRDRLNDGKSKIDLSRTDGTNAPFKIMVIEELGEKMQNLRQKKMSRV